MWIAYNKENEYYCGDITELAKVKGVKGNQVIITFEDGDTDIIKAENIIRIKAEY